MHMALDTILNHRSTVTQAAAEYSVPVSALGDHVRGRVKPGARSGPPKYMTNIEEAELVDFLLRCVSIGYPKTRKQVLAIVQRLLDSRNAQHTVNDGWWASFCRRHPELSLRTPAPLSVVVFVASHLLLETIEPIIGRPDY